MGDFAQALEFGKAGERSVSEWLQSRGHLVFPAYETEGKDFKGPQLFSAAGDFVLPDLLAFRGGSAIWFEVKRKSCFSWHRLSQKWVTGIDLHHYKQYREVSERTGLPVWLMFYHPQGRPDARDLSHGCPSQCPTGLFAGELSDLVKKESHRHENWGRHGMVYWAAEALGLLEPTTGGADRG